MTHFHTWFLKREEHFGQENRCILITSFRHNGLCAEQIPTPDFAADSASWRKADVPEERQPKLAEKEETRDESPKLVLLSDELPIQVERDWRDHVQGAEHHQQLVYLIRFAFEFSI